MPFDMLEAMTLIAREKNIDFDSVVETLEASLLAAAKKKYTQTDNISFRFDRKTNELFMIVTKKVVDRVVEADAEVSLDEAKKIDDAAELGDELEIYLDYEAEFGRNAIASAKQILIQKIRDVEHERIYAEYHRQGQHADNRRGAADRQRQRDRQPGSRRRSPADQGADSTREIPPGRPHPGLHSGRTDSRRAARRLSCRG